METNINDTLVQDSYLARKFDNLHILYHKGQKTKSYPPSTLYKYLNLDTAVRCLNGESIVFAEPVLWKDEYESRFYSADYSEVLDSLPDRFLPKPIFACCFTTVEYSEPAWMVYSYGEQGLGHKCIELKLNFSKLKRALSDFLKDHDFSIYCGKVDYHSNDFINSLHYQSSDEYNDLFGSFSLESFLSLLLVKRKAYRYEDEYRVFIVPNKPKAFDELRRKGKIIEQEKNGKKYYKLIVDIKWREVIEDIKYDSSFTESEIEILRTFCRKAKIQFTEDTIDKRFHVYLRKLRNEKRIPRDKNIFTITKEYKSLKKRTDSLSQKVVLATINDNLSSSHNKVGEYAPDGVVQIDLNRKLVLLAPFDINKMTGEKTIKIGAEQKETPNELLLRSLTYVFPL